MPTQHTGQSEQGSRAAKLHHYGRALTAATSLLGIIGLIVVYSVTTRHPQTDDAEIFANYIGIAPVVEGPILHLNVADNQHVKQGDLLFEIDDRPYKYALDHAMSDQAALEGQIVDERRRIQAEVHAVTASGAATRGATANVDRAQASISEAEADVAHSEAALDRAKTCTVSSLCLSSSSSPLTKWTRRVRPSKPARSPCTKPNRNWLSIERTSIQCWPPWRRPRPRQSKSTHSFANRSPAYLPSIL